MSVKTCQLCGKPLGRIRGGDGEFCSREHRSQFRLRRSMDHLLEANKVASLMRRRENPKQIPAALLISTPVMEQRGLQGGMRFEERKAENHFRPLRPVMPRIAITQSSGHVPLRPRTGSAGSHRVASPAGSFGSPSTLRPVSMPTSSSRASLSCGLVQADLARVDAPLPGPGVSRRECAAVLRISRDARPEPRPLRPSKPWKGNAGNAGQPKFYKSICHVPVEARSCVAAGFRTPQPTRPDVRLSPGATHGLTLLDRFAPLAPVSSEIDVPSRPCAVPIPEHPLRVPHLRVGPVTCAAPQPEAFPLTCAQGEATGVFERGCVRNWEMRPPSNSIRIVLPPVVREFGTHPAATPPVVRSRADSYRLAEVPFATPSSTFEPRPLTLHGSLDAPGAEVAPPPAAILEDDFNSGLANWTGDTAGWRFDAAGARPAGLALFEPSLEWGDYEFEFLTRIEKRAVTFVFRAPNTSNYQKITIGLAESRRYELQRSVVIEGAEEQCETVPLGEKPKATFPVKVCARRNDFTISLDGEVVARWTDGRLPAGGIGFTAMKGDQARVYWVRLAPLTGTNLAAVPPRQPRSKK